MSVDAVVTTTLSLNSKVDENHISFEANDVSNKEEEKFKSLYLRRLVRENHCVTIHQCGFAPKPKGAKPLNPYLNLFDEVISEANKVETEEEDSSNILCTVGGNQLNTYDSMHCGDHLDLVSHFTFDLEDIGVGNNDEKESTETVYNLNQKNSNRARKRSDVELTCFCWPKLHREFMVCCSGTTGVIHVISLTRSIEIDRIYAHKGPVFTLFTHPLKRYLISSISADKYISIWDLEKSEKKVSFPSQNGTYICFNVDGSAIFTGTGDGCILDISIDGQDLERSNYTYTINDFNKENKVKKYINSNYVHDFFAIDCLRNVNDILVSKSISGIIAVWNIRNRQLLRKFRVENYFLNLKCLFDLSPCAKYCAVGNPAGVLYIYNIHTGKKISGIQYSRCSKPIHCATFDYNYKCVVSAGEEGYIWRFNYKKQNMNSQ